MKKINFIYEYETPIGGILPTINKLDYPDLFLKILDGEVDDISNSNIRVNQNNYKGVEFEFSPLLLSLVQYTSKYKHNTTKQKVRLKHISEVTDSSDEYNILLIEACNFYTLEHEFKNDFLNLNNLSGNSIWQLKNNNNFYIWLLDFKEGSYEITDLFKEKIDNFLKYNKISKNKILYSNCNNFIKRYNSNINYFPVNPYITEGSEESNVNIFGDLQESVSAEDLNLKTIRPKRFLSYNRNSSRLHRLLVLARMYKDGILDSSIVSCYENDYFNDLNFLKSAKAYEDLYFSKKDIDIMLKFVEDKYPIHLDFDNQQKAAQSDNFLSQKSHYLDSYVSIVNETSISSRYSFITEKCIRPILGLQPFIVFGNPHTLKKLQEFGIETFSDIIDESYDLEMNTNKRFEMAYKQVLKLNNLPIEELHEKYMSIMDILTSNKELIHSFRRNDEKLDDIFSSLLKNIENKDYNIL